MFDCWVFVEDSGICVDVFDGVLGIFLKRFVGEMGDD